MKRIIQGLVLAALVTTAQAAPFPAEGEPVALASQSTYADRHVGERSAIGNAFAADGEPAALVSQSTYADRHTGERSTIGNAFPADGEPVALSSQSTYADRHAMVSTASKQAALSE